MSQGLPGDGPPGDERPRPEDLLALVHAIDVTMKRRRMMLAGYFLALLAIVVGIPVALGIYGQTRGSGFAWIFFAPPALAGVILWIVGWAIKRVK